MKIGTLRWWGSGTLLLTIALVAGIEAMKQSSTASAAALSSTNPESSIQPAHVTPPPAPPPPAPPPPAARATSEERALPFEIKQVIRMMDAGVPAAVLEGYVRASDDVAAPSAEDLIYLAKRGLSPGVMLALLQRSKELDERSPAIQPPERNPAMLGGAFPARPFAQPAVFSYGGQPQPFSPGGGFSYPAYYMRSPDGGVFAYYPASPAFTRNYQPYPSNVSARNNRLEQKPGLRIATPQPSSPTQRNQDLAQELKKVIQQRDEARRELTAWHASSPSHDNVEELVQQLKQTRQERQDYEKRYQELNDYLKRLHTAFAHNVNSQYDVVMRDGLKGTVEAVDPKWGFVVLDVGSDQGVLEGGTLLVRRGAKYISKILIRSVEPNHSIANIVPAFQQDEVKPGDEAFY